MLLPLAILWCNTSGCWAAGRHLAACSFQMLSWAGLQTSGLAASVLCSEQCARGWPTKCLSSFIGTAQTRPFLHRMANTLGTRWVFFSSQRMPLLREGKQEGAALQFLMQDFSSSGPLQSLGPGSVRKSPSGRLFPIEGMYLCAGSRMAMSPCLVGSSASPQGAAHGYGHSAPTARALALCRVLRKPAGWEGASHRISSKAVGRSLHLGRRVGKL